jgi:hypothetical protein
MLRNLISFGDEAVRCTWWVIMPVQHAFKIIFELSIQGK